MLRSFFRLFNRFMLWMWHNGMGAYVNAWPPVTGRIMVLTTTGRKSGQPRQTPVNYALIDGDIYCTAGFGAVSDWYRNLMANPKVEVWLPDDSHFSGLAEDIIPGPTRLPWLRTVLQNSGFAAFAAGINPYTIDDSHLEKVCRDYCLVRIQKMAVL